MVSQVLYLLGSLGWRQMEIRSQVTHWQSPSFIWTFIIAQMIAQQCKVRLIDSAVNNTTLFPVKIPFFCCSHGWKGKHVKETTPIYTNFRLFFSPVTFACVFVQCFQWTCSLLPNNSVISSETRKHVVLCAVWLNEIGNSKRSALTSLLFFTLKITLEEKSKCLQ